MSWIPVIQWKGIEILQKFKKMWIRLMMWLGIFIKPEHLSLDRSPFEAGLNVEKKNSAMSSSVQGKVGFRYIMETHCKLPSRFLSFFSPMPAVGKACRVPLDRSFFLFHLSPLSFIV